MWQSEELGTKFLLSNPGKPFSWSFISWPMRICHLFHIKILARMYCYLFRVFTSWNESNRSLQIWWYPIWFFVFCSISWDQCCQNLTIHVTYSTSRSRLEIKSIHITECIFNFLFKFYDTPTYDMYAAIFRRSTAIMWRRGYIPCTS